MKVSFLVTYYNQREYVEQSLESILAIEKPCDWEILIGDDGSTDGTVDVVREYIKKYPDNIRLYIMPREEGKKYDFVKRASANRLNILENSTGDIFCTIDGDDYYCDSSFIKDVIDIFEHNNDVTVVAFGYRYVKEGILGKGCTLPIDITNKRVDKQMYIKSFYVPAGGCVHRKCFGKERIDYIKKLGYFDDNDIVINSLNFGEMYTINKPIYAYRQTGESIFTSMNTLEQAILNVQGMDMDIRLVDESLKDIVIERYSDALVFMYIWRKRIKSVLGDEKCNKYKVGCTSLMPSYCYYLLNYSTIGCKNIELQKVIKRTMKKKKIYTVIQYIKYCLRGIL